MEELWACVDSHLASRQAVAAIDAKLDLAAHQLRAVQKRLLLRYKDKQPASVAHLDLLIHATFNQLQDLGTTWQHLQSCHTCKPGCLAAALPSLPCVWKHHLGSCGYMLSHNP